MNRYPIATCLFVGGLVLILSIGSSAMSIAVGGEHDSEHRVAGDPSASSGDVNGIRDTVEWRAVKDCIVKQEPGCALEPLDRIIENDPNCWEAIVLRAKTLEDLGEHSKAKRDNDRIQAAGGSTKVIESRLSQQIDQSPEDTELIWRRAIHRWKVAKDIQGALSDLGLLISLADGNVPDRVLMMKAQILEVQGDLDGAIIEYSTVVNRGSASSIVALTERARLFDLVGRDDDAALDNEMLRTLNEIEREARLERATRQIESGSDNVMSRYVRGMAYADAGDLAAALRDAEEIIRMAPDNLLGYSLRSQVRLMDGDVQGYREDRMRVKELKGDR